MTAAARHKRDDARDRVLAAFAAMSPHEAATVLGLDIAPRTFPGARVVRVSCVWHSERHPSCDLTSKRGAILARCRSCNAGGDVFGIVAAKEGLDVRADFRRVLDRAAELVGVDVTRAEAQPLSPLDLARAETRAAKREVQRVREAAEKAACAAREEHALAVAEMVARADALTDVVEGMSTTIGRARSLLPPLRQACERGTRDDVRAAVARLEEALT